MSFDTGWWAGVCSAAICLSGAVPVAGGALFLWADRQTIPSWPLGKENLLSHHHWWIVWGWEGWKYMMLLPLAQDWLWILSLLLSVPAGKALGDCFSTLGESLCTNHQHETFPVWQRKNKIAPDKGLWYLNVNTSDRSCSCMHIRTGQYLTITKRTEVSSQFCRTLQKWACRVLACIERKQGFCKTNNNSQMLI